jgi:serine/threonine-protein kinase
MNPAAPKAQIVPQIAGYRIDSLLGKGAFGSVYKAEQVSLGRIVAIKALDPLVQQQDPQHLERFLQEARLMAQIGNHENIVQVYNLLSDAQDLQCIVMEYVEGETIEQILGTQKQLDVPTTVEIMGQTLLALELAHEKGIVHRDIKPGNIIISPKGIVKVTDFGLARILDTTKISQTGLRIGTPLYMAPEQWQGGDADARSDLYSLSFVAYNMLAGNVPFEAINIAKLGKMHLTEEPEKLHQLRPDVPNELRRIIEKGYRKNPEERYASATEMRMALEDFSATLETINEEKTQPGGKSELLAAVMMTHLSTESDDNLLDVGSQPTPTAARMKEETGAGASDSDSEGETIRAASADTELHESSPNLLRSEPPHSFSVEDSDAAVPADDKRGESVVARGPEGAAELPTELKPGNIDIEAPTMAFNFAELKKQEAAKSASSGQSVNSGESSQGGGTLTPEASKASLIRKRMDAFDDDDSSDEKKRVDTMALKQANRDGRAEPAPPKSNTTEDFPLPGHSSKGAAGASVSTGSAGPNPAAELAESGPTMTSPQPVPSEAPTGTTPVASAPPAAASPASAPPAEMPPVPDPIVSHHQKSPHHRADSPDDLKTFDKYAPPELQRQPPPAQQQAAAAGAVPSGRIPTSEPPAPSLNFTKNPDASAQNVSGGESVQQLVKKRQTRIIWITFLLIIGFIVVSFYLFLKLLSSPSNQAVDGAVIAQSSSLSQSGAAANSSGAAGNVAGQQSGATAASSDPANAGNNSNAQSSTSIASAPKQIPLVPTRTNPDQPLRTVPTLPSGDSSSRGNRPSPLPQVTDRSAKNWVVGLQTDSDFKTIDAAMRQAVPGDEILVRAGTYHETIMLREGVTLVGEDPLKTRILGETGDILITAMGCDSGTIKNIGLYGRDKADGIVVIESKVTIEGCNIQSMRNFGIKVEGEDSFPTIQNNVIKDNDDVGIVFALNALGKIVDNEISKNKRTGIEMQLRANPYVSGNSISGNLEGIFCRMGATGRIENNDIFQNIYHGIKIVEPETRPRISNNQIRENSKAGILITDGASAVVQENRIERNQGSGIQVSYRRGAPEIIGNKISKNQEHGIQIEREATPVVRDNTITENFESGVFVSGKLTEPEIQNNTIQSNVKFGMHFGAGALGEARENLVEKNRMSGFCIEGTRTNPKLLKNESRYNEKHGFLIQAGAAPSVTGNISRLNKLAGFAIIDVDTRPNFMKNKAENNRSFQFFYTNGAIGTSWK